MAHDKRDSLHLREADLSILHHLFLPCHLPSSEQDDYLTKDKHENEYELLECLRDFFQTQDAMASKLPVYSVMKKCISNWSNLQNPRSFTAFDIQTTIERLQPGEFFSLYFYNQNAAILIEMDENNSKGPLISSWQVLLPTNEITSSLKPHLACFPLPTYRLQHRSQLSTRAHCELLIDFMRNTIEHAKSYKASIRHNEIRDVPESHYVCQWWIMHFQGVTSENNVNKPNQFNKKHRDQIRWSERALLPFRRSGLWMVIKVVLQTILTKRLKDNGTLVYKLLMTQFLTHVIHTRKVNGSMELLVHCLRKIARRLNKIDVLLSKMHVGSGDMNACIKQIREDIESKLKEILPKSDWQQAIQIQEDQLRKLTVNHLDLSDINIYRHQCEQLDNFLKMSVSNSSQSTSIGQLHSTVTTNTIDPTDDIPSFEYLTNQLKYEVDRALTRMEIWVELKLAQWINRQFSSLSDNDEKRFKTLSKFFEGYKTNALSHYCPSGSSSDSIGYSRFILTSLTIIHCIHERLCQDTRFSRLREHSIDIPNLNKLFIYLILPTRDDMIRAYRLYDYFRQFKNKPYPDLLSKIDSEDAFGVYFAGLSEKMNDDLIEIQVQSEVDKEAKRREVLDAKKRYRSLINKANDLTCECTYNGWGRKRWIISCTKCNLEKQASDIQVPIYECPIPSDNTSALAVMYELQMPMKIRYFREILWLFTDRLSSQSSHGLYEWLDARPHREKLRPYYTGPANIHVNLVSTCKSLTQSHYSNGLPIATSSVEDYLCPNGLKVGISPPETISFSDERHRLTAQLPNSNYKCLQFSINNTQFVQNRVIAKLSDCSVRMKSTEFVEFGSFRSGHCLQWWNLLSILELESLSFEEESVAILIIHSLFQYGPFKDQNAVENSWCTESHRAILNDQFFDELISRLNRRLNDCEYNWQNENVLIIITMISIRILTLCNATRENEAAKLVLKCREVGEKWIDMIVKSIQNAPSLTIDEIGQLRNKLAIVGITCQLTYSTHSNRLHLLLSKNEHIISLLKAITTFHDQIILNKNQPNTSVFISHLIRFSRHVLKSIQPLLTELLKKISYRSLNNFSTIYCAVLQSKGLMNGNWQKRSSDIYDGWYDGQYQSVRISIDCLRGTFLVNGMTVGFLPATIISSGLFLRVFNNHVFEVQADQSPNTYITKNSYHGENQVRYTFHIDQQTGHVNIFEQHDNGTKKRFQLISHECFAKNLPDLFVSNYSHWRNLSNQQIEFRPIRFDNANFLKEKTYLFTIDTGYLTTFDKKEILLNQSSEFYQTLYQRYFRRLDDQQYVYMMNDHASDIINETPLAKGAVIHIYLSRLGIAFKYHTNNHMIASREYSDMFVAEDQWLGTLTGLQSGLLLSPIARTKKNVEYFQSRKLIVPFGKLRIGKLNEDHQIVTIKRDLFVHQYFTFNLNDRLRIIQSTDSPTGWLYLALLHALTSHPLPDQYTGMTGMERSFQLLKSTGCWTDQPYDEISRNILRQIAAISPNVNYYPPHLTVMVKIDWNNHALPYSLQHFGYYLMTKNLIDTSQQLNFMYPSLQSTSKSELTTIDGNNERLLEKLYWDYRDFYNSEARLTKQMEETIFHTCSTSPYQGTLFNCPTSINDQPIHLNNDLYASGSINLKDESQIDYFPLAKWLGDGYQLKTVWIGLLKKVSCARNRNEKNELEKVEILLDFLHYISLKIPIRLFYLQMLRTVLKTPTITFASNIFPVFGLYENISQISVPRERISLGCNCTKEQTEDILDKIERCFSNNCAFTYPESKEYSLDVEGINRLLTSWQNNKKLRSFLDTVQSCISSVPTILSLNQRLNITLLNFSLESLANHHPIQFKSTDEHLNRTTISHARRKFCEYSSENLTRTNQSIRTNRSQTQFPDRIFPSTDERENSLANIASHFHKQLSDSWQQLNSIKQNTKGYPSKKQIEQLLQSSRLESKRYWNELLASMKLSNELLIETGVVSRIVPTILISLLLKIWSTDKQQQDFHQSDFDIVLTTDQCTLLGGIIVNWVYEQQMERALHFAQNQRQEDFEKEIINRPHTNWRPSDYLPWLIMELEMNITIRKVQVEVAYHMMQLNTTAAENKVRNLVMQMNMGEGKTSVIIPMLALSLCSASSSLVRIVVLKSLFKINYQSLRYKLGGLLNRRIFPFACRRQMNFKHTELTQIFQHLQAGLKHCDIILTSPEYILSFNLLTLDKCRREEFDSGQLMMNMEKWMKKYARDVLDESDEILHVKYQLIYTVGGQEPIDGGLERWKIIQEVLRLVKSHALEISKQFGEEVSYQECERKSAFPQFRLLSIQPFVALCKKIAKDWLAKKDFRADARQQIESFILNNDASIQQLNTQLSSDVVKLLLVLRGLLSSEVLFVALQKRHRVNFGVNKDPAFNRLMAVPFRAKDVAAENTEFGHPDVAIVLTQLSYYYSGLNHSQLQQCFERLRREERNPELIYDQWISFDDLNHIHPSIQQWKGINLNEYQQRTQYLFPILQHNMMIIDYFLDHFVFPREAKQFPEKLIASPWDLSSSARSHIITGFSGTNDTQLLLPIQIRQCDLPELQHTDALVVTNLLRDENEYYESLPIEVTTEEILKRIVDCRLPIQVILDVGALFIDGTNRQIAVKWLELSDRNKIEYAVYFESDSIFVCDRQLRQHPFLTSPASERLDRCVIYLDEIHTRGSDFKFPSGFRAALTLGHGLTKDRLVQAAMRMRKLGSGHSLMFWSSFEVDRQIRTLKTDLPRRQSNTNHFENTNQVTLHDILRWVYENTQQATWDGLHHWAAQSLNYQRKTIAMQNIEWSNMKQALPKTMIHQIARNCLEPEVMKLEQMYGASKQMQTADEIYTIRYKGSKILVSMEIHEDVSKQLKKYGGTKRRLAQLLDEEQERELEHELEEERQIERPPPVNPWQPILHEEIKKLSDMHSAMLNLAQLPGVFSPLAHAFKDTTFFNDCQPDSWRQNFWISTEFQHVIENSGESLNPFLRLPRWVVVYRKQHVIFVNALEANWLMKQLNPVYHTISPTNLPTTTLRLFLPRLKRSQEILVNTATLTIPPTISSGSYFPVPLEWLVELFIFNGSLYFRDSDEQHAYCKCLGICINPRTPLESQAFEKGVIDADGFVSQSVYRRRLNLSECRFPISPVSLVKQIIENRNDSYPSTATDVGSILFNQLKLHM